MAYFTFITHPLYLLAFTALILGFVSLWVHKSPWLWGSFIALSLSFAVIGKLIDFNMVAILVLLCLSHIALEFKLKGVYRLIPFLIAFLISFALLTHLFSGFHNWLIVDQVQISQEGYPYTLYLNFDKPFVGFFPLALTIPLLRRMHLRSVVLKTIALTALGVMVLMVLALHLGLVSIDLKVPMMTPIWLIANLFLVVIPEEAFFRGFLQREINDYLNSKWGGFFNILIVSFVFTLLHVIVLRDPSYLLLAFIASTLYGGIYHITRSIESSIFCHYFFNVVHFLCFTYPILK